MIGVSVRAAAAYAWPVSCQSRVVLTKYGCQEPQKFGGFFLKVTGLARHKDVGELTGISAALGYPELTELQPCGFTALPTSSQRLSGRHPAPRHQAKPSPSLPRCLILVLKVL